MDKNFKLIRGARIVQQLDEATARDLEANTMNFAPPPSPDARQHAVTPIQVQKIEFAPDRQENTLTVKVSVTNAGQRYEPQLKFDQVVFEDSDQGDNTTFKAIDGRDYHITPIQLATHNAKVRCNCLDFYYRFAPSNSTQQALLGDPPPPYVKRSDRPLVNPQKKPGVCKHLLRAIQALKSVNVVR